MTNTPLLLIVFALLTVLLVLTSYPRRERYKNVFFVVAAFAFSALILVYVFAIQSLELGIEMTLLNDMEKWIEMSATILPDSAVQSLRDWWTEVAWRISQNRDRTLLEILPLLNVLLLASFLVIKLLLFMGHGVAWVIMATAALLWRLTPQRLKSRISRSDVEQTLSIGSLGIPAFQWILNQSGFPHYIKQSQVFLHSSYITLGLACRNAAWAMALALLAGILIPLAPVNGYAASVLSMYPALPALGLIIFLETGRFLDGPQHIDNTDVQTEITNARTESRLLHLYALYAEKWETKLLTSFCWKFPRQTFRDSTEFGYDQIKDSDARQVWNSLLKDEKGLYQEDFELLDRLWNRQDLLLSNLDRNRAEPFLHLCLKRSLTERKTILVVIEHPSPTNMEWADQVRDWITFTLNRSTHYYSLWNVADIDEFRDNNRCDVLVASFRQILDLQNMSDKEYRKWFERLDIILIPRASHLLSTDLIEIKAAAKLCDEIAVHPPQWILFSENAEDIHVPLELLLPMDLDRFPAKRNYGSVTWGVSLALEGDRFQDALFRDIDTDLGEEAVLALPARKAKLPTLLFANCNTVPWNTHASNIQQSRLFIKQPNPNGMSVAPSYLDNGESSQPFTFIDTPLLLHNPQPEDLQADERRQEAITQKNDHVMLIIRDSKCNTGKTFHEWSAAGNKETLLVMISKSYMFRDYFADNMDYFLEKPMPSLMPSPCETPFTVATFLNIYLKRNTMDSDTLLRTIRKVLPEVEYADEGLDHLMRTYFDDMRIVEEGFLKPSSSLEFDKEQLDFVDIKRFGLSPDARPQPRDNMDIYENRTFLGKVRTEHVHQCYAVGQLHVFKGRVYEILGIDHLTCEIAVRLSDQTPPADYRFIRKVSVRGFSREHRVVLTSARNQSVRTLYKEASIRITDKGYLTFETCIHLTKAVEYPIRDVRRKYPHGRMLHYTRSHEQADLKTSLTLAVLLNESFQTLFPETANRFVMAAFPNVPKTFKGLVPQFDLHRSMTEEDRVELEARDGRIDIFIVEDSRTDAGLIVPALDNMDRILIFLCDYLSWVLEGEKHDRGAETITRNMGRDFTTPDEFLRFGFHDFPEDMDYPRLHSVLKDFKLEDMRYNCGETPTVTGTPFKVVIDSDNCLYCNKDISEESRDRMENGKYRCSDCSANAVISEEGLKEALAEACAFMEQEFGMKEFAQGQTDINAVLASQDTILDLLARRHDYMPDSDSFLLGAAEQQGERCTIHVESGAPYPLLVSTCIHELATVWLYRNIDRKKIEPAQQQLVVDGLARWAAVEYLNRKNILPSYVEQQREAQDRYGAGLRHVLALLEENRTSNLFTLLQSLYAKSA